MKDLFNGIPINFTYRTIVKLWENPTLHRSYCYSKFLTIFMISKQIQNMQLAWVKLHLFLDIVRISLLLFFLSTFLLFSGLRIICLCRFDKVDMALLTVQDNPSTNNTFRVPSRLYWLSILYIIIEWLDLDWSYTKMNTYVSWIGLEYQVSNQRSLALVKQPHTNEK